MNTQQKRGTFSKDTKGSGQEERMAVGKARSRTTESMVQVSPAFPKSTSGHFAFPKDLRQYLFGLTERNLKRIFTYKNMQKVKAVFSIVLHEPLSRQQQPRSESGPTRLLPREPRSFELCLSICALSPFILCICEQHWSLGIRKAQESLYGC